MDAILNFPSARAGVPKRPAPEVPAAITPLPSRVTRRAYLRREGLRLAAGGGLVSIPEIERRLRLWHTEAGLTGEAVDADIADALAFAFAIRDAALAAVDGPKHGPNDSGRCA